VVQRTHDVAVYIRVLVREEAWSEHPCFPTSQYSLRDNCVVWDVLDLYEMNI